MFKNKAAFMSLGDNDFGINTVQTEPTASRTITEVTLHTDWEILTYDIYNMGWSERENSAFNDIWDGDCLDLKIITDVIARETINSSVFDLEKMA